MGKAKQKGSLKKQKKKNANYEKAVLIGAAIFLIIAAGYLLSGSKNRGNEGQITKNSTSASLSNIEVGIQVVKKDISSTAKFYPYESDGIKMEILAVKADDGTIRTAFNTCQVCYPSGRGYYVQEDDELVCQNCGNRFKLNMVGITKGGCNPVPILDESKADDGTNIIIDKNYLDKNKAYFSNWKS